MRIIDIIINIIIPLGVGVIIYYLCRQHSIYFLKCVDEIFDLNKPAKIVLPNWIVYNLPDGLWNFAFTSIILIIWKRELKIKNLLWFLFPVLVAIILEFFLGTYDILDMIFIIIGGVLPIIINTKIKIFINQKQSLL